ncbi:restriction endonuclease [Clostridium sp. YIM B02505]|uniref:Restriction endonuclease n=1 Tax=Clostridium yunnanense TaxID=2800325 RepID=A0ABS1EIG9_9CLOT|nr:restriction endonuclease [Clostridium yunnanense]MBK1809169.1 restriction endonuclease [Clostridium yunnanense]
MIKFIFLIVLFILLLIIYFIITNNDTSYITPRNLYDSDLTTIKNAVYHMHPRDFEFFTAKLLSLTGNYSYEVTSYTNDGGKDVILKKRGEVVYLECKHLKDETKVGRPHAQKLCGAMVADNISKGIIVTLKGANKNCLDYCTKLKKSKIATISIDVINLDDLINECLKLHAHTVYDLAGISDKYINIK